MVTAAGSTGAARTRPLLATSALGVVVAAVAVAVLAAGGQLTATADLLDAGPLTRWALPAVTGVRDAAASVTVGLLALAVLAMRNPGQYEGDVDTLAPQRVAVVRWSAAAALLWTGATVLLLPLTLSEVTGRGLLAPGFGEGLGTFLTGTEPARLLLLGAALALAVTVGAARTTGLPVTVVLLVLSAGALLAVAAGGHAATESDHSGAVNSLFVHLLGVTVWAGGLLGLVLLRATGHPDLAAVARRFSAVALVCFAAVTVSGAWRLVIRIERVDDLLGAYGAVLAAKVLALALLGAAGLAHRRRTLRRLTADPGRWVPFLALVTGEVAVIAVATGLGVALSRTPLP